MSNFDYEKYEAECEIVRKENNDLIRLFEVSLNGLSNKTIRRHKSNVDLYLNDFMLYSDAKPFKEGIYCLDEFFGYFFIKKCLWSTPSTIRSTATSIRKFYKCMLDHKKIDAFEYEVVCDTIKDQMDEWKELCAVYNDPEQESPFVI